MTFVVSVALNPRQQNCFGIISSSKQPSYSSKHFGIFHCFLVQQSETPSAFVVQVFGDKPPFNYLHLNPYFAKICDVKEDAQVILEPVIHMPTCLTLELEPLTFEDWNIVESSACVVEELFLDQIRVVQNGMQFVLFLGPNLPVKFTIARTEPDTGRESVVLVDNSTQVLVIPKKDVSRDEIKSFPSRPSTHASLFADKITDSRELSDATMIREVISDDVKCLKLRIFPQNVLTSQIKDVLDQDYGNVNYVIKLTESRSMHVQKSLVRIQSKLTNDWVFGFLFEYPQDPSDKQLKRIANILRDYPDHCIASPELSVSAFQECSWISVTTLERSNVWEVTQFKALSNVEKSADLLSVKELEQDIRRQHCSKKVFLPVIFTVVHGLDVFSSSKQLSTKLIPEDSNTPSDACCFFWSDKLPKITIVDSETPQKLLPEVKHAEKQTKTKEAVQLRNFGAVDPTDLRIPFKFQTKLINSLSAKIEKLQDSGQRLTVLLTGNPGTGRTTLLKMIAKHLFQQQCFWSAYINCLEWKGKSCETIEKQLEETIKNCQSRKPSVVLLDNVHFLNTTIDDEERRKFVEKLYKKIANKIKNGKDIHVICSTETGKQLPESLTSVSGSRLFDVDEQVKELGQDERKTVLEEFLDQKLELSSEFIKDTENCTLSELIKLAERTKMLKKQMANPSTEEVLVEALKLTPTAGKEIYKPTDENTVTFGSIGGLQKVKEKLREIFLWQNKYEKLYKKCGLRIGGGAILHGPSGCGKTLLMKSLCAESGFNVVSVKGPELLSKYIGASEQNVRNVFQRARNARPCLIIFDEFDSLAPKRGHDSTGVTDRVVNQLLTELDGVDSSNEGVYVVGATNRIDLMDEALLRPGRFDHKIFVDYPDIYGRTDILRTLSSDLALDPDVDFGQLAVKTIDWTSAELRGLVLNANFEALDDHTRNVLEDDGQDDNVVVTMKHFNQALESTDANTKKKAREVTTTPSSRVTLA